MIHYCTVLPYLYGIWVGYSNFMWYAEKHMYCTYLISLSLYSNIITFIMWEIFLLEIYFILKNIRVIARVISDTVLLLSIIVIYSVEQPLLNTVFVMYGKDVQ